ncbi:PREDICTED: ankyrin repeat and SAM domain-containing protein 1A-like isoform X2 [Acropora digitifera]|uniref:ankyrin repeat and SAM domain-containing protein 1A-like isoform X2 n=1 Tax=Acropora digitifera TaxID=70779 RepID=UPI00077B0AA9|nr:PREDICTED: ankyrin repeat and SAM domain-containing protein 1A-like isoform X2 [Acropora digitifera]
MSLEGSVSQFLESLGLQEFTPSFMKHGFDRVQDVLCLDDQDLALVIPDEKKRGNFIKTLRKDPQSVKAWLHSLGLDQYYDLLQASGFTNLAQCSRLSMQSLHEMQNVLPGHKKRLFNSADVFPPGDPRDHRDKLKEDDFPIPSKNVRFMVDSGSDIVTLSDHVIEELKLPVIGRCQQEVAGGDIRDVSLYSACLGIGKRKLNITVVPDKINTLGTPVMWQFHHRIDGEKHMWLAKDED